MRKSTVRPDPESCRQPVIVDTAPTSNYYRRLQRPVDPEREILIEEQ